MKSRLSLGLALLAAPALASELPVRGVTLSSASLVQLERAGEVSGDATVTLSAPVGDVDDLLKSLVVLDPAGRIESVRLPAQNLVEEAFRTLPLKPDDFESRASLFRALRGQQVSAGGADGAIAEAEEIEGGLRLSLVTPTGLVSVLLKDGDSVRLADADLAAKVSRATDALAAARLATQRTLSIVLRAPAAASRTVTVLSVTGAPVWKPSYRLIVPAAAGDARLSGWAVVENASGADWRDVRLSLVSGNPATFRQALYRPVVLPRPEAPLPVAEAVTVRPDTGPRPPPPAPALAAMAERARGGALAGGTFAGAPAAAPPPPPMEQMAQSTATEVADFAGRIAFTLANPVTIAAGETANVPIIDASLPAQRVWWVQDVSARFPIAALRLSNNTASTLPAALATLYGGEGAETGAHLGDAQLAALPPGETRLLGFARDRDVQLSSSTETTQRPIRVSQPRGRIVITNLRRETLSLAVDPRGRRGVLLVDLPRRDGWRPQFSIQSQGDFGLRHEAALDGARATIALASESETETVIPLWAFGPRPLSGLDWRGLNLEADALRLPGGPGSLERLRDALASLPENAPGRPLLVEAIAAMTDIRQKLDAWRSLARAAGTANAALDRLRQAVEDRSGPAREDARRALNAASLDAERAAREADAAWNAWRSATETLLAREG